MPGIGLIKRRLETKVQAIALATSHVLKVYDLDSTTNINTLETKYDTDAGDWYVALEWQKESKKIVVVIQMDSILGTVTNTKELCE